MEISKYIKELNKIYSTSSLEKELNQYLKNNYLKYTNEFKEDRLYSIFGVKKSKNKNALRLMIACAMDEIGLMIDKINNDGTLSFIALENLSSSSLLHQEVTITTFDNKKVKGFITSNSKYMENAQENIKMDDLIIDTGLDFNKVSKLISIGDIVSIDGNLHFIDDIVVGRSLNQKIFQMVTMLLFEKLKDIELDYEINIGCIGQSTIGYRGSKTATHVIEPDVAIVLTGFEVNKSNIKLNDGVILGHYDKQMLPDKKLLNNFKSKVSTKPYIGFLGNDGSFIHKTLKGTPCISIGIPMKNMGTSCVFASIKDIEKLVDSLVSYLKTLKLEEINSGVKDCE